MDPQDLDTGLLGIQLSSDSEGDSNSVAPARNAQSEEAFREVKRTYRVKVEDGEIHTTIPLPLGPRVSKPTAQALLHAVEELYYFGRYAEGARFARAVLHGPSSPSSSSSSPPSTTTTTTSEPRKPENGLDDDTRATLRYYERRCLERERERGEEEEKEKEREKLEAGVGMGR
ncbi:hypothetical protein F5X96DRAFT_637233 [Biscogniauxia mediterranea]|nr:hypothetical protein F5X96DRAFT_637233 [Biscogniauxia mediterranea]